MGHTGVGVRDRTVTKTRIKLSVVTVWNISSDSPLHWIPCHSSLIGQIDKFMHNWGLYNEKENEESVFSLAGKGGWVGDEGSWKGEQGGGKERQLLPWTRGRDGGEEGRGVGGCQRETGWCLMYGGRERRLTSPHSESSAGSPHPAQLHTEPPHCLHWGRPAMSSGDCKWIKPSGLHGKLIYSLRSAHCSKRDASEYYITLVRDGKRKFELWEDDGKGEHLSLTWTRRDCNSSAISV